MKLSIVVLNSAALARKPSPSRTTLSNLRLTPVSKVFDVSGFKFGLGAKSAPADVASVLQRLHDLRRPEAFRIGAVGLEARERRHRNGELWRETPFGLVDRKRLRALGRRAPQALMKLS